MKRMLMALGAIVVVGGIVVAVVLMSRKDVAEPSPIGIAGSGRNVVRGISLEEGLAVFSMKYDGQRHFGLAIMRSAHPDLEGKIEYVSCGDRSGPCEDFLQENADLYSLDFLASEIGSFNGSHAWKVKEKGVYYLDVKTSEGAWAIDIAQPRPASAPTPPVDFNGDGNLATAFFKLKKGAANFDLKCSPKDDFSSFNVQLINAYDAKSGEPIGPGGCKGGSKTVDISESGIYLLNIDTNGAWSVSIRQ